MFVWIKKSRKKSWFKLRGNLRRKIKYQISCCIRGPFSLPPNMPGKRVTLLGGKNIHELQLQRKEIKAPLRVKQTRNKAEQNGPIIEPLWKMCRQFLCFDWLATLRCGNILYVAKRTSQVAAFEWCWSTALPRDLVYQISTTIHLSPSLVWICLTHIYI